LGKITSIEGISLRVGDVALLPRKLSERQGNIAYTLLVIYFKFLNVQYEGVVTIRVFINF
jgi:hypothetical protein